MHHIQIHFSFSYARSSRLLILLPQENMTRPPKKTKQSGKHLLRHETRWQSMSQTKSYEDRQYRWEKVQQTALFWENGWVNQ